MSYIVQEEHRRKFLDLLTQNSTIDTDEVSKITDAFQVASGQSYAIGKTKAMLDFLSQGNTITIIQNSQPVKIHSAIDLYELLKSIDQYIDIKNEPDLAKYF